MAQRAVKLFSCSICLDPLKDPLTIPCGHSYCLNCITAHWDKEDAKKIYSCPQCRRTFPLRPVPVKNTMLAVSLQKKTGLQAAPADHCYPGPEDVACDSCPGRKRKAVRSCLKCLVSYCEDHLQPHYQSPAFKKHKLVRPSKRLQENICSQHDEVMKMFCRTDQQSICYLCSMDKHKGHDTVSAAAERTERQKELELSRQKIQQSLQEREKAVKVLQQKVEAVSRSADKAVEDTEKIFTELICLMKKRNSDEIRSQQQIEVRRVKEHQEKLKQEITELKRKDTELMQLSHTEDHNQFLHNYSSLPTLSLSTHSTSINLHPLRDFEDVTAAVTAAVTEVKGKLQDIWSDPSTIISPTVTQVDVLLPQPEPRSRDEFLKYSKEITLDPNTVNTYVLLFEGNRKATWMTVVQHYSSHPERFTYWRQALSIESLTGQCYWEVEWRGEGVSIAVAYKNISREGQSGECRFGFNNKSWSLECYTDSYNFYHDSIMTKVSGPVSSRVGVYLDHSAGILSFYRVSDSTITLLHRVQTTFTQPLYAGVILGYTTDTATEFCKLKADLRA